MKSSTLFLFSYCVLIVAASCRSAPTPPSTGPIPVPTPPLTPAPLPPSNPKLPPIPDVRGPLEINVIYPKPEQLLTVRDSNFIFGSVGSGDAALNINGVAVPVWPNGAFMGWLPVPPDTSPLYVLTAANKTQATRLVLPVKVPPAPDTTHRDKVLGDTLQPPPADTVVPVTGNVYVTLGNPASTVNDTDRVTIAMPEPRASGQVYKWFLFPGTQVRVTGSRKIGTTEFVRVELDSGQEAWVLRSELQVRSASTGPVTAQPPVSPLPSAAAQAPTVSAQAPPSAQPAPPSAVPTFSGDSVAPIRRIGVVRIEPTAEWIDVVIPITGPPPPYLVEETDRSISLLVYSVSGASVISMMPQPTDDYMNSMVSTPESTRVRYSINLNRAPYGYLALWQNGMLTFRLRRPPRIVDAANPLRGLTITVDPGHPPAGATGPTALYEGDGVLQVGFRVRDLLTQRGANVVMTRTGPEPVELGLRPIISRRANAHAFVSIHLNAFPDGVNPFVNNGSLTLYFWPHSIPLGVATQAQLLAELGLRDNGTKFQNIAVARGTWMPSILTEGAFVIMPDQEAALRTPTYQEAYATAVVRGLESYFASLAQKP
ncbi:MAG: N-acetylmuramoyl-L-alanine amidase [Gemmatimonadaceae bacterium]